MKTLPVRWFIGLGLCIAASLLIGCGTTGGAGGFPGAAPGGFPPISYMPNPGGIPWYNVGYPGYPGNPSFPVVLNPSPLPGTSPGLPSPNPTPSPNPGTTPTIPVGMPGPEVPDENSLKFWSPWPLPPRGNSSSVKATSPWIGVNRPSIGRADSPVRQFVMSHREFQPTSQRFKSDSGELELIDGNSAASPEDLKFRGGRVIRDLFYVNLYISGDTNWSRTDVEQIDGSLSVAMRDEYLNNVLLQYFNNQSISATALPSHPLVGYTPKTITRGDIQNIIEWLNRQGFLKSFELQDTVFNLLLPSGTVLTADNNPAIIVRNESGSVEGGLSGNAMPPAEEGDSLSGLAGYHGSVVTTNDERVYYTVSVYSERGARGTTNGIPVFAAAWKNVVATLYHQLAETRTDPDVEEAMRHAADGSGERYLGWVSDSGLEIGDYSVRADIPLTSVFREVSLASGGGRVPVQLLYSNAAHAPEGPISQPHSLP
jgi:hypothetical protein